MNFILQPWHIVLLTVSRNFNDTGADDYLRGTALIVYLQRKWDILSVELRYGFGSVVHGLSV